MVIQAIENNDRHQKRDNQGIEEMEKYLLRRYGNDGLDIKLFFCPDRTGYGDNLLVFFVYSMVGVYCLFFSAT